GFQAGSSQAATALRGTVVSLVERYYAPFDVQVVTAAARNITDIYNTMNNDAGSSYVLVGAAATDTGSISANLWGQSTGDDIGQGNNNTDSAIVLADHLFAAEQFTIGRATDPDAATSVAHVITHEAGHTFGLAHTYDAQGTSDGTGAFRLTQSDII